MLSSENVSIGLSVGTQPPLSRVGAILRAGRAFGFDVAWVVDHFQGFMPQQIWDRDLNFMADPADTPHAYFDYQALMGYLARRAGRVHLGVGVTETIRRHPVLVAQAAMTVAHMTQRAPILGIGAGERENTEPYGLEFTRPVGRLEEALQIIRLCFESRGPIDFAGDFFVLSSAPVDLLPPQGRRPQIWLAAHGPRMLRLAGVYGDGWFPALPFTPETYAASLDVVRASAASAGRNPSAIVPGWQGVVMLAKTEREARALLDAKAMRFAALLVPDAEWQTRGLDHPLGPGHRGFVDFVPQRHSRAELEAAMSKVPIDLIADTVMWGTPETVYGEVRNFVDAGMRHVLLQPISALVSKSDAVFSVRALVGLQRRLKKDGV